MQYLRLKLAVLLVAATLLTGVVVPAHSAEAAAQTGGGLTQQTLCTINGVPGGTCTVTVTGFQVVNGVLNAVGTIVVGTVTMPFQVPVSNIQGTCQVLDLTLGPLHLDLLGLVVDLNQVVLHITAQDAPGALLGNLLCTVSHLLDSNASGNALANLLNRILGILGGL